MVTTRAGTTTAAANGAGGPKVWLHAPSRVALLWLAVSLPLVIWDTIYVLGRPYTMEGGWLHWPFWAPYKLYGEIDHVYGWKAFNAKVGFTGAQGFLNAVETAMYLVYLYIYRTQALSAKSLGLAASASGEDRSVLVGRSAAVAVLIAFSANVMTFSKTVLYWLCEYFGGFDNIGHNSLQDLIFLWIIPNGAWLILPSYIIYILSLEIVDGLTIASSGLGVKEE